MTTDFYNKILEIDGKRYAGGVLGRMDAVLRLSKQGYARKTVLAGLDYISRKINNAEARQIAFSVYSQRVR